MKNADYCIFCLRPLSGKKSRARGYGDRCAVKNRHVLDDHQLRKEGNVPLFDADGNPALEQAKQIDPGIAASMDETWQKVLELPLGPILSIDPGVGGDVTICIAALPPGQSVTFKKIGPGRLTIG